MNPGNRTAVTVLIPADLFWKMRVVFFGDISFFTERDFF